ncbi:MAG: ammonium transporter, partial [Elusimicrobiota bacterium]
SAVLIGITASVVCYIAVNIKNKLQWDDALDVWGVHGVGGVLGVICLGILGNKFVNAGGADGLVHGGVNFFLKQTIAVAGTAVYAFIFTYVMLFLINMITPVRTSAEEEEMGLDESVHGETAYLHG